MKSFDSFIGEQRLNRDIECAAHLIAKTKFPIHKFIDWYVNEGMYLPPESVEEGIGDIWGGIKGVGQYGLNAAKDFGNKVKQSWKTGQDARNTELANYYTDKIDPKATPHAVPVQDNEPLSNPNKARRAKPPAAKKPTGGFHTEPVQDDETKTWHDPKTSKPVTIVTPTNQSKGMGYVNQIKDLLTKVNQMKITNPAHKKGFSDMLNSLNSMLQKKAEPTLQGTNPPTATAANDTKAGTVDQHMAKLGQWQQDQQNQKPRTMLPQDMAHTLHNGNLFPESFNHRRTYESFKRKK